MMRKVVVGAAALMLLASAYAYAQQPGGMRDGGRRWQPRAEDRAAFLDARLAGLHAGLKLTPDQEKSWPAFEQAYRELAALRAERMNATRSGRDRDRASDPIERAQKRADALTKSGAALKHYADAAAPLLVRASARRCARWIGSPDRSRSLRSALISSPRWAARSR